MQEKNHPNNIRTTDWELINTNDKANARYNEILEQYTQTFTHNPPKEYTEYFDCVKEAGHATATKMKTNPTDWFEMSEEEIQPTIDIVTTLLKELQECNDKQRRFSISTELKLANKIQNITIPAAKSKYLSDLADKIGELSGSNCKAAWKAV